MIVVGQASAAATSVAIPAHQPGDLILVFTRRASNTTVTKPTAGGTVPSWTDIQAGAGANTLALRGGGFIAHRSDHTTGVWGSASHICVLVLRPDTGKALSIGPSSLANANNVTTITYPALTLADADGSSWGIRVATRSVAHTNVGLAPGVPDPQYTAEIVQPAGASCLMSVHSRAGLTANPTSTPVGVSASGASRAFTIEIREDTAPAPTWQDPYDNFDRADDVVYAGAGAGRWEQKRLDYDAITGARVVSNQLGLTAATWHQAVSLFDLPTDFDLVFDVAAPIGAPNNEMAIWFSVTSGAGASPTGYTLVGDASSFAAIRRYSAGTNIGNIVSAQGSPVIAAGDSIWIARRNPLISYYHRRGSGPWVLILQASDANIVASGRIALEMSDTQVRYDNVRGGPWPTLPAVGPTIDAADTVTVTDNLSLSISPLPVQTGLAIWLDANDDASFVYSSGVQVSQWSDKSPSGYHFPHPSPTYQPFRDTTRNGKKTVRFPGAHLLEPSGTAPFQNNNATIFAVLLATTHRDYAGFLAARVSGDDYSAANGFDLNNGATGNTQHFLCDRASAGANVGGAPPTPFAVYTSVLAPTSLQIYKNGVAGTPGGSASGGAIGGLVMGCRWLAGAADPWNYGMQGEWAELVIYNRVLTAPEIAQVEQYLREKWLLPVVAAETVTVSDSLLLGLELTLNLSDTVTASESLTPVVALGLELADTQGVGDFLEVLEQGHALALADTVTTSDVAQRDWDHALAPADTVTTSDLLAPLSADIALAPFSDTVGASDSLTLTSFTPLALTGCKLWLDASVLTPGVAYAAWTNLAPGGVASLTAYSSPAPVVTTPQAGQNGLPVMRYTAPGGHQTTAVQVDRDQTMVVVARMTGGANQRLIGGVETVNNFLIGWHGGDWDMAYMDGWLTNTVSGIPTGLTWKMYSLDSASAGFLPRFFANGIQLPTGAGATQGWRNAFSLGGGASYGGQPSNCEVAEVILYNRKLSDLERQQVEDYLRQKWITPGVAHTLGPSDGLADTVTTSEGPPELGFQWAMTMPPDAVTVTESLGIEVALSFSDGVNVSDDPPIIGAAHFVDVDEVVTTSDLFGTQIGEDIVPCNPNPIVGTFKAGGATVGTYWVCAKKGILALGAIAPSLTIRNLAAEPAGLELGGEGALFVGQKPTIPGGGMYLGGYAPGFSLKLTPPLGALGLRTRVPLNVGLEPPIYPAGLELGGSEPKFAGREPPVESAGLGLGGYVPAFKFSQRLAAPPAGLELGGGIPVQVEEILILPVSPYPIDLLPVIVDDDPATAVAVVTIDLLSSPAVAVTLEDVETVDSDDLNEVECV